MKEIYRFGTSKNIRPHRHFAKRLKLLLLALVLVVGTVAWLLYDLYSRNQDAPAPVSKTTVKTVTFDNDVYSTPYFRFTDSGNWKLADKESTDGKFIFRKYLGKSEVVQHQLLVYVNTAPGINDLASSRVLPVEIKLEDGFTPSEVSAPCGDTYAPGEPHRVKSKQVDGATLMCDPDSRMYKVIFSKKNGDYNLKLRRENKQMANYIIIYQNQMINPDSVTLMNIANSFQTL